GEHGAIPVGARWGLHLDEVDGDFAVHAQGKLVMAAGEPGRYAFGAHDLLDIFHVLAHHDAFVGFRPVGDLEDVGKDVMPGFARHQLDAAFGVVRDGPEDGVNLHRDPPFWARPGA